MTAWPQLQFPMFAHCPKCSMLFLGVTGNRLIHQCRSKLADLHASGEPFTTKDTLVELAALWVEHLSLQPPVKHETYPSPPQIGTKEAAALIEWIESVKGDTEP